MRILQVASGFAPIPPVGAYAVEMIIHNLSSALVALGHEIMVLDIEEENRPPVPYQVTEVPLRWQKDINLPTHILRGFAFKQASGQGLKRLRKEAHFDIANFHNQFSAAHISLVRRHSLPAVYTLHNPRWYEARACRSPWLRLKYFQDLKAMRKADMVICLNQTTRLNLARYFGVPLSRIAVVPLGIDESWLANIETSEATRQKYAPNDELIILNVARIAPYKNQLTLAKAIPLVAREVPEVRFLFAGPVGDRSYAHSVRQAIAGAGVERNAVFLGEIPYADLPQLYSLSKIFAITSESEAFGIVVLEAMASGKAIVASDIETFQETVGEGRGITVPIFDHEALADAILNLLRNEPLRQEIGQQAKEYVQLNYTWESVAAKTVGVYKSLTKGNV